MFLLCGLFFVYLYIFKKLIPQKDAKGLDLMRRVCDQLNVQEREYFGLLFNHKKEKVRADTGINVEHLNKIRTRGPSFIV